MFRRILLAGLILLAAPVAHAQGGLTAPAGVEVTPMSLTLDESASVKRFDVGAERDFGSLADPPNKTPGWTQIVFEGGGDFPNGNGWNAFDQNPASGEDYWDDVQCRPFSGNWSIWCADIGNVACSSYDDDMNSWMIVGPFSLTDAQDAQVLFNAWSQLEDGFDSWAVLASTDGTNFFGSGSSQDFGWSAFVFDLTNVFTLGDLRGEPNVLLAFIFTSDGSVSSDEGVYLDDILIEKLVSSGGTCTPDATTLCLPDSDRFKVTLYFETVQGPGNMGDAQAISLDSVGITKGGILHFGDSGNPEVLVKVLDGCGINNRWWVFYAATTNVGFELTVEDTVANVTRIYTNPDIHPADTITDTQAFATCP